MSTLTRTAQDITAWCRNYIGDALGVPADSIDAACEFDALGLDSAVITSMLIELEEWLGIDIPPSTFFSYNTMSTLSAALADHGVKEGAGC